jgi:hypothetical protein
MADKKISALTGATTPLAGTEVLPIVQSGSTVKVAVSDLTAGRAVSATGLTTSSATSLGFGTNGSISQMTLNTGGIVGLGVTPSTWLSTKTAIQMPDGAYYATTGGTMFVGANVYANAAGASTYVSNGYATRYRQTNGEHQFWTAVSGTAETTIPFTQVLNLGSDSNVNVNAGNLSISTSGKGITTGSSIPLGFGTNTGTAAMTLNTTGTLSVFQATTAAAPTYVKGAMYFDTTLNKLRIGGATGWETVTSV